MESGAPVRTCIGCRRKDEQGRLLRISREGSGEIGFTTTKNRLGRGAYVCPAVECLDAALKGDRLARSLRLKIDEAAKERLRTAGLAIIGRMTAFQGA